MVSMQNFTDYIVAEKNGTNSPLVARFQTMASGLFDNAERIHDLWHKQCNTIIAEGGMFYAGVDVKKAFLEEAEKYRSTPYGDLYEMAEQGQAWVVVHEDTMKTAINLYDTYNGQKGKSFYNEEPVHRRDVEFFQKALDCISEGKTRQPANNAGVS